MNVFVYINGASGVPLGDIEDALDRSLQGKAEVTGSGAGQNGCSFDLEVTYTSLTNRVVVDAISHALGPYGLIGRIKIVIGRDEYDV